MHSRIRRQEIEISKNGGMDLDFEADAEKEMLVDNLNALLKQENSGQYKSVDYLSIRVWERNVYDLLKRNRMRPHAQSDARIDEYCREQIVEWSFRVVDYFRIDREVVVLSLSFLDRFLATCQCDRATFKLAATATLNLAVKLLHPCKLGDLGILSDLSRGEFDMYDVSDMEKHVLTSLQWSLHPPTPIAFSTLLLDFMFCDHSLKMTSADIDDLHDISAFFTELAVCDYYFVSVSPSAISVACIINALEGMFGQDNRFARHVIASARKLGIYYNHNLSSTCHRLWELYERSEECALHNNFDPMEEEKCSGPDFFVEKSDSIDTSPVTVASKTANSVPSDDFMCAMRSQSLRNGSW